MHGDGGLDEISLTGPTQAAILKDGEITLNEITPEEAGLELCEMRDLKGGNAAQNAKALEHVLAGSPSAYRNIVCLNTAASLMIAGKTNNLRDGVAIAAEAIDNGGARHVLNQLVEITNQEVLPHDANG